MPEKKITIFHWNVKYGDPTKEKNKDKYTMIANSIARVGSDVVVLTEITTKVYETGNIILERLIQLGNDYGVAAALCVDGGNSEHHLFLIKKSSGYKVVKSRVIPSDYKGRQYQVGAGTRGIGLANINHTAHPTTFIRVLSAHPSPCSYTKKTAVANAQDVVAAKSVSKKVGKNISFAFMVGDFNSESDGSPDSSATVTKTGANTHSSALEIDFSVHEGVTAIIASGSRVQTQASDHSYQHYELSYNY